MKIGFVTTEFVSEPYFSGGLANYIYRVSKALIDRGHDIHVIILTNEERDFEFEGIHVHRIPSGRCKRWISRITRGKIPRTSSIISSNIQLCLSLIRISKEHNFDILQLPNYLSPGIFSLVFFRSRAVTRISSYTPVWNKKVELEENLDNKIIEFLEWVQIRLSKHVYAPSYTLKEILKNEAKIESVDILRTPFYLEVKELDLSKQKMMLSEKKYLLFFGRYQLHKGFHILVQALPRLLDKYPELHAVFVGVDCPTVLGESMEQYALSICKDFSERLIFLGQTPHSQLYPIISESKLVVLPSLIDNLPNACLEAMALGKPVVGTIGTSLDELISDRKTGFLAPPDDVDALSEVIEEAWNSKDLEKIGNAAKVKMEDFSPEITVTKILEYYQKISMSH